MMGCMPRARVTCERTSPETKETESKPEVDHMVTANMSGRLDGLAL